MQDNTINHKAGFRFAWIVLFSMSLLLMVVSLPYIIFGRSLEPKANLAVAEISNLSPYLGQFVTEILRVFGLSWFTWGFLSAAISVTAYRKGELWAWYAFWIAPVYEIGDGITDYSAGGTTWWVPMILAAVLIGTLIVSPQFTSIFRKKTLAVGARNL